MFRPTYKRGVLFFLKKRKKMGRFKQNLRLGFKRGLLKKALKRQFNYKWYSLKKDKQTKQILRDVKFFPEELIDFLMEIKPQNKKQLKTYINDWLHLEAKATNSKRLYYEFGKGEKIFREIYRNRLILEILTKLNKTPGNEFF